jgi:hypothetical protein
MVLSGIGIAPEVMDVRSIRLEPGRVPARKDLALAMVLE